jgi:hypothetical protein
VDWGLRTSLDLLGLSEDMGITRSDYPHQSLQIHYYFIRFIILDVTIMNYTDLKNYEIMEQEE